MGIVLYPPHRQTIQPTIFLAGSIEMGKAEDWQAVLSEKLLPHASVIYNPRRLDWDNSWEQSIDHPEFRAQVEWELDHLIAADIAIFHFQPGTMSPVTLMELGHRLPAKPPEANYSSLNTIVSCPQGFWRKGNVDILCARHGVKVVEGVDDLFAATLEMIKVFE